MSIDIQKLVELAASKSNSPFAAQGLNAIANNDSKTGEALADNILKSMGMTREQGVEQAKKFFGM